MVDLAVSVSFCIYFYGLVSHVFLSKVYEIPCMAPTSDTFTSTFYTFFLNISNLQIAPLYS